MKFFLIKSYVSYLMVGDLKFSFDELLHFVLFEVSLSTSPSGLTGLSGLSGYEAAMSRSP